MRLCDISDIRRGGARGFLVGGVRVVVHRGHDNTVHAYINRCPHLGVPLNWEDDAFMDSEDTFIRCATHGALFEPATGMCVLGPCRGENLWQLDCVLRGMDVHVDTSELPAVEGAPAPR